MVLASTRCAENLNATSGSRKSVLARAAMATSAAANASQRPMTLLRMVGAFRPRGVLYPAQVRWQSPADRDGDDFRDFVRMVHTNGFLELRVARGGRFDEKEDFARLLDGALPAIDGL